MKKTLFCFALFLGVFVPVSQAQVTVAPFISPAVQFFDNNGDPLTGGKVCTFAAGTSTPLGTYSDLGITLNSNPVILDSAGRGTIYLTAASYKIVIAASTADSSCNPAIKSQDNITWSTMANTVTSLISNGTVQVIPSTAATSGANQSSPNFKICGNYWTGSASAADCWNIQDVLGTGSNPTTTFNVTHSGSSGTTTVNFAPPLSFSNSTFTNATLAGTTVVSGTANVSANITATAGANTINAGNINNGIHIDGVKYPITQAGIQQAFTDACALGNGNGTDVYLPAATTVTLSNVATSQFTITCPLHVHGPGASSFWFAFAATANGPLFDLQPTVNNEGFWEFDNFRVTANTGGTGDIFFLDGTNGTINNLRIHDVNTDGVKSTTSWFMNATNPGTQAYFFGHIWDNNIVGGINFNASFTDSWLIEHNSFNIGLGVGGNVNPCVNATTNTASAHYTIFNNNGGCLGGEVISHGTQQPKIIYNQFEQPGTSTETNSAMIDLLGDTVTIDGAAIIGNNLNMHNFATIGVRLDKATHATVSGNTFSSTAGTSIIGTANSSLYYDATNVIGAGTVNGESPTCGSATGLGATGACNANTPTSSTGMLINLNTNGGSTAATGNFTITLPIPMAGLGQACNATLRNSTSAWNARATIFGISGGTSTSQAFTWDNNAVALTNASAYTVWLNCSSR